MRKPTFGSTGSGGHKRSATNKSLAWLGWLLATCGFGVLLGGLASMQSNCYDTSLDSNLAGRNVGGGTTGYLAPVGCNHLFQYTWFITFLHFFVWFLVFLYLITGILHKTRPALIGMLAVVSVLLMDTANTYLMLTYITGLQGTNGSRIRATVAGAIIAAVADMFLILVIGWDYARHRDHYENEATHGYAHTGAPGGANIIPGTATTTTTAGTVPVHMQNV